MAKTTKAAQTSTTDKGTEQKVTKGNAPVADKGRKGKLAADGPTKTPAPRRSPADPAPAKGGGKKPVPSKAPTPASEKPLNRPQQRVLLAMLENGEPMTRAQIGPAADVQTHMLALYIGATDDAWREMNDEKYFPSLLSRELVTFAPHEGRGAAYELTPAGRKAAQALDPDTSTKRVQAPRSEPEPEPAKGGKGKQSPEPPAKTPPTPRKGKGAAK